MRKIHVPFSTRQMFDALDPIADLPKTAGVYVWIATDRKNPLRRNVFYIGRARNIRERCLGKFGAKPGTTDHRLIHTAHGVNNLYHMSLWVYPLPRFNPWINIVEALLIQNHWGRGILQNAKREPINLFMVPIYGLVAFIDGVLSGAVDGLILAVMGGVTYGFLKFMQWV